MLTPLFISANVKNKIFQKQVFYQKKIKEYSRKIHF